MNYFGAYHTDIRSCTHNNCDAPFISRGRMSISGAETATTPETMAMFYGNLRNRSALSRELGCPPYADPAQLILKAYLKWDEEYVRHIEGPCVSCIVDVPRDRMLIARDPMGECCLFFAWKGEQLVFSDHPDSILRTGFIEPVVDKTSVCEIFGLGPARTPGLTQLSGVKMLKPGHMLICQPDGVVEKKYFELEAYPHEDDFDTTVERLRAMLEEAVGDVVHLHPACMLSGGIDSTALTALLCMRIGRVDSFSVDYLDNAKDFVPNAFRPEMDEPYIRMAVRAFGTRHRNVMIEQEMLADTIDKAMNARGFPGMADIDASLMLLARSISKQSRYAISGECGDEVFGGYPWFRGEVRLPEDSFPWSGSVALRSSILKPEVAEKANISGYVRDAVHSALDAYDVSGIEDADERARFKLQRLCFDYFMPNLQERAVRMCECVGLNVLTPFCDDRIVRYVYNVPWAMKTHGGVEKGLLRAAVKDIVPEKLCMRKKSPYPKTCSSVYSDLIRKRIAALVQDANAPIWQLVDVDRIEKMASGSLNPADTPWFGQLMAGPQMLAYLLQVNQWMEQRNIAVEL